MSLQSITRIAGSVAALALLSACATKPQISAQQESSQYLSRAGRNYTAPGPASDPWGPYITEAAAKYDVPERWIREVMRQESGGNLFNRNGQLITSGAGAMGLMQVMPGTYDELRARYRELGDDPFDPHNNIMAGTAYIREMYDIYGAPGFLAAYNAGPGRLDDYLTRNRTLPEETRRYVASIGPKISGSFPNTPSPGQQYAMNAMPFQVPDGPRYASNDSRYSATPRATAAIALNSAPYVAPAAPAPIVLAQAAPIVLAPEVPRVFAQAAPAPRPFITLAPEPQRRAQPVQLAALPLPPAPPRFVAPSRPVEVAQAPDLPRRMSAPPRQQYALVQAMPPPRQSFALVSPANASPIRGHAPTAFASGGWAVQVGAFANQNVASAASASARDHAREVLGGAHTQVATVRQGGGVLYRARLTGLSRDAASHACERLARARTNCMVVSPEAQF